MTQDEIIAVLQRLQNTAPLDPDPANQQEQEFADWYVQDLHGQQKSEVIKRLKLQIMSTAGARHAYLFTGTIGSGKSTELRRLAYELKQVQHFAKVINITDYLNPQEPLGLVDLLMAISLGACEGGTEMAGERFDWWTKLLKARPEGKELEVSGGFLKMKFTLQNNPSYRERLRRFFASNLDELVREANAFLYLRAEAIRAKLGLAANAKCVLLIDSLEQFGGLASAGQDDSVLNSLVALFNHHSPQLRFDGWSVLYSVPPLLQKLAPGIAAHFPQASYLTSAHVFNDRSDTIDETTVTDKLIPLLKKRLGTNSAAIFSDPVLRDMVIQSGGDLRLLLRITADALLEGLTADEFPVSQTTLEKVYNLLRRPYLPLPKDTQKRLAYVREHKEPLLETDTDWPKVMSDLAAKRILLYLNGTEWYDVHPLLRNHLPLESTRREQG